MRITVFGSLPMLYLRSASDFQLGEILTPPTPSPLGTFSDVWTFLVVITGGGELLTSSEKVPGTLLKILQCPGRQSAQCATKSYLAQNVSSTEVEQPRGLRPIYHQ